MRIVTKINFALAAVLGVSALLNFAALHLTVMPSFRSLENATAEQNQSRVIEAIGVQKQGLASSARDWAFWDDTYQFMHGERLDYVDKNVDADSMGALGINYLMLINLQGDIVLDKGFLFTDGDPAPIRFTDMVKLPDGHALRHRFDKPEARAGLVQTDKGLIAIGYAPILTSDRTGEQAGTLVFGKFLDVEALRAATKVDFALLPVDPAASAAQEVIREPNHIEVRSALLGLDGSPLVTLVSKTSREISAIGGQAVWAAMGFLLLAGVLLIASLAFVLRRIALKRIEAMRAHLVRIASTGDLELIPADHKGDELSETVASFNDMAIQLRELREKLRRRDYHDGAADQAAGILHNVRNAISPVGTIAWDLTRAEEAPWKGNLASALQQLGTASIGEQRSRKLQEFVALSAARLLKEGETRLSDLQKMSTLIRHVDEILKNEDALSQTDRTSEAVDICEAAQAAAQLIAARPNVRVVSDLSAGTMVLARQVVLEQVLGNLLLNAAEAIEATGNIGGTITLAASEAQLSGLPAIEIRICDDGDGISPAHLEKIFMKGFSTRRERSSGVGLHWCANAVNAVGGRFYAESEGAGHGATLHLVLPLAKAELEHAA